MAEIAELAEAVADEHCPTGAVEPAKIAADKGLTLSFGRYGDAFDGMLEYLAGRFHVYVNLLRVGAADAPRSRFTVAHELGHYFIDEHRQALVSGLAGAHGSLSEYESPADSEQEADAFAANLLMPRRRFVSRAKAAAPGLGGVLELAGHFGVSITATAIQYALRDIRPCAVVKWDWRGYSWKHLSTSALAGWFRRTFESPADLSPDSPTRRALAREAPPAGGYFESGTVASAWFPGIDPGQWGDAILIEQAVPLGRFGVLTFLSRQR